MNGASSFVSGLGNIEMYSIQLAFAYWMGFKDRIFKNKISCLHRYDKGNFNDPILFPQEMVYPYVSEAEILNMALSGKTAVLWRSEKEIKENKRKPFNVRDFASTEELVVLINLEDTNADLILHGIPNLE